MEFLKLYTVIKKYCAGKDEPDCKNHVHKKDLKEEPSCPECKGQDFIYDKQWNVVAIAFYTVVGLLGAGVILLLMKPLPPLPLPPLPIPTPIPEELPSIEPQNTIKSLDISPDGRTLVGGSEDGKIGVWDTQTGQVRFQLSGHNKPISAIAMSADGQTLISASENGTIKAWDLGKGKELYTLSQKGSSSKDNHPITALAVSADGQTLLTGGQQKNIQVWKLNTQQLIQSFEIETGVESLAVSEDAKVIVSGNYSGKINIWKLNNKRYEKRTFDSGSQEAHSVAISSNGEKIVSSSCKDKIQVWNTNTFQEPSLVSESDNDICLVAISNDGKTVAGLNVNSSIKLWNLETHKELYQLSMPLDNSQTSKEIRSIAFSGDGRTIAASFGQTIQVWQLPGY